MTAAFSTKHTLLSSTTTAGATRILRYGNERYQQSFSAPSKTRRYLFGSKPKQSSPLPIKEPKNNNHQKKAPEQMPSFEEFASQMMSSMMKGGKAKSKGKLPNISDMSKMVEQMFPGMVGNGGNKVMPIPEGFSQAIQLTQNIFENIQSNLDNARIVTTSAEPDQGAVEVTFNGRGMFLGIKIGENLLNSGKSVDDVNRLLNDTLTIGHQKSREYMKSMAPDTMQHLGGNVDMDMCLDIASNALGMQQGQGEQQ